MGRMWWCTGQSTGKTTIAFNCEAVDSEEEMVNTLDSPLFQHHLLTYLFSLF